MPLAAHTNRAAKYIILRSIGAKHTGFPVRKLRNNTVPAGYELLGYANSKAELFAILSG